ncbi:MAG: BolA family transcriptional regulator [Lysobacterales bacterium]|jgi:acid stress-induced BolA-like protein IbaG/YrbA|nr:MAG: BolA family transcriptional regulator [Xanthomonadales bacterium]
MKAEDVQRLIETRLPGARVRVSSEDGVHFEAKVICPAFSGRPLVARHRMVYETLGALMGGAIHALSLKTLAPEEADPSDIAD